jgi:hypothetical protein
MFGVLHPRVEVKLVRVGSDLPLEWVLQRGFFSEVV